VSRRATYLRLGRVSNLPTVWTNAAAGIVLAGARPGIASYALLAGALSLFYVGGMFLNDAFDREIDACERPERPIPSGAVGAAEVFGIGFGLLAAGMLAIVLYAPRTGPIAAALVLAATIVLYDLWHKTNPLSPVVMGACRALVYVTAALAVSTSPAGRVVTIGAGCLFAYLIGLTYAAKQEQPGQLRRLWPLVLLMAPLAGALAIPTDDRWPSHRPLAAAVMPVVCLLFLGVVVAALTRLRGTAPDRFPRAIAAMIAAISLADALAIAGAGATSTALVAILGWPATLVLQRWVRGT